MKLSAESFIPLRDSQGSLIAKGPQIANQATA